VKHFRAQWPTKRVIEKKTEKSSCQSAKLTE